MSQRMDWAKCFGPFLSHKRLVTLLHGFPLTLLGEACINDIKQITRRAGKLKLPVA
jgi:hypothetical protein